jgi:dTDP-4-amino-4,6-dideoxygalactose transaminase
MILVPHSHPDLGPQDAAALKGCVDRGFVGWDKDLEEVLKKHIQKFVCKKHVVLTPSGSMALGFALRALGVKPGDGVLMPGIDCCAVYNAIKFFGATPVVCDVRSPKDFRSSFDTMARQAAKNVKVVIVTHMFGVLIEPEDIRRLKEELKIRVIEDYASSFGALYNNSLRVGKFSDFVIGSFGSTKPITAGAGGFIAADRVSWADANIGPADDLPALNCQMSCLNQRLLQRQFARLDQILEKKNKLKDLFSRFVKIWSGEYNGLWRAITFDDTSKLKEFFKDQGFVLDIRDSAQPNLARSLGLKLSNARNFDQYSSLPFHSTFAGALEFKGLLK